MNNKQTGCFILLAVSFLISLFFKPYAFSWVVKILPMAFLIYVCLRELNIDGSRFFIVGLAFSALGDFFLDYDRVNWFVFGLGSFFVAHLFYVLSLKPFEFKHRIIVALYVVYGCLVFALISAGLGDLFFLVVAYMSLLLFMAIATLLSAKSNKWFVVGGVSFVISDSLIGIDKFYSPIPYASLLIMCSYYFAQYALTRGFFIVNKKAA